MTREEIIKGLICGYSCTEEDECFEGGCRGCLDKMFNEYEKKIRADAIEEFANWLVKYKVIPDGAMAELIRDFNGEREKN